MDITVYSQNFQNNSNTIVIYTSRKILCLPEYGKEYSRNKQKEQKTKSNSKKGLDN